jgi:prepilin-type N-terminal cleavage/methylation domain-containing protein
MDFRNTFIRYGKRAGFTLVEVLITTAITLVVAGAVAVLYLYSSRAFLTLDNYADMNLASQVALDKMSKDIRQAKLVTAYTTNSLTFQDVNGNPLQFNYDPAAKTLVRVSGGKSTTYLTNCDALQFWIYQPTPTSNSFTCYSPAFVTNARVVQITWACSRSIRGLKSTTESMESAQIAMRNH